MRLLLIDNYDSFTWNLQHALVRAGAEVDVIRNDELIPAGIVRFDGLVLSPGPGLPDEAGQLLLAITVAAAHHVPTLGVCLGMQAMAQHFGATLRNLETVLHGQVTQLTAVEKAGLFTGIQVPCAVGHYHSWVVDEIDFPKALVVTARNEERLPMAMRHTNLPMCGVQFHPESIMTPQGHHMLQNWLDLVRAHRTLHPVQPSMAPLRQMEPDLN